MPFTIDDLAADITSRREIDAHLTAIEAAADDLDPSQLARLRGIMRTATRDRVFDEPIDAKMYVGNNGGIDIKYGEQLTDTRLGG